MERLLCAANKQVCPARRHHLDGVAPETTTLLKITSRRLVLDDPRGVEHEKAPEVLLTFRGFLKPDRVLISPEVFCLQHLSWRPMSRHIRL